MLTAIVGDLFQPSDNPHSLSVAGAIQTPGDLTPPAVAQQWAYAREGLQGLPGACGLGALGACGGGCASCGAGGLGELDFAGVTDWLLSPVGLTVVVGAGLALLFFGGKKGNRAERRKKLDVAAADFGVARADYEKKVARIKAS